MTAEPPRSDLKPYKCKYCEYACRDNSTLRKHHERHMGVLTRYTCNLCEKRFSKKHLLQFHVAESHIELNLKKIPCGLCDKMFRTKKLMNIHIEVRHNRKYATTCEICGFRLANKYNMKSHLLSHVAAKPYKCAFAGCDKRYKDSSTLQKHSRIHYPDQQFPCNICGKRFTRKERLRKHKKQHLTRVKKAECDYCGVRFYNKNYLSVHILKKHSQIKKVFICDLCDFKSGNKPGLIKHIKGHSLKVNKDCPICKKKYKQEKWLRHHMWHAHKVMEYFGTSTLETNIKVEPMDEDGVPEFELFEIEKEETFEFTELHSINDDLNVDETNVTQEITDEKSEIHKDNDNVVQTTVCEDFKDSNISSLNNESNQPTSTESNDVQLTEHSTKSLLNDNISKIIRTEDVLAVNENLGILAHDSTDDLEDIHDNVRKTMVSNKITKDIISNEKMISLAINENVGIIAYDSTDELRDVRDNVQKIMASNKITEGNISNEKSFSLSNSEETHYNTTLTNPKNVIVEESCQKNSENQDSTKSIKQNDLQIELGCETIPSPDNKEVQSITEINSEIGKVGSSKGKSLAHIKASLKDKKKRGVKKKSKHLNETNKKQIIKRKSLAQIRAALIAKKQTESNKITNSESLSESEELEEGLEYSKGVLSEDIARCMTQKQKKDTSKKNFDDFFIERFVQQHKKSDKKVFLIDKDSQAYAENYVDKLLKKTRNDKEVKLIERTRRQYNERIRKARKIRPEKVSIKYFEKTIEIEDNESQNRNSNIDNDLESEFDVITEGNEEYGDESLNKDKCDKSNSLKDNSLQDSNNETLEQDPNINNVDEKVNKTQSHQFSNENLDEEQSQNEDCDVEEQEIDSNGDKEEANRIRLRSQSGTKKRFEDDGSVKNVEFRKIKINTHQCYVCFKLFESKEMLLDHCKDHFEVCNSTILKKCPLCDFATNLNIVQHMKTEHDVEITIPSTKIIDKASKNGPGYCYKVNSATITDIDVIPSVKHLNKQAYINIDKKNRKLKDTGIAKTKLIKKGNEWIVERKTAKIDNVEEFILPKFNVDEILSIKIDSNDYLSRMKKLYRLAKKHKKRMLFPCESCDKICQTLSALKLHYRRHDPKSKPFRKKVWKHKINDMIQPKSKKNADIDYGRKNTRVVEIDKDNDISDKVNDNRYKEPKPVVNKHKCDPELIKFYENNIKGGDVEFWQFLKIFNKMSRDNVNDFNDLNNRPEFGIHMDESRKDIAISDNKDEQSKSEIDNVTCNTENTAKDVAKDKFKIERQNRFKRVIKISRKAYLRRNELKQKLRDKIAKENIKT